MNRDNLLAGEITHQAYNMLLADAIGRGTLESIVYRVVGGAMHYACKDVQPIEYLRRCLQADQHLNNIPLSLWDRHDSTIRAIIAQGKGAAVSALNWPVNDSARVPLKPKTFVWSLSETVSLLKCVARAMVEAEDSTLVPGAGVAPKSHSTADDTEGR